MIYRSHATWPQTRPQPELQEGIYFVAPRRFQRFKANKGSFSLPRRAHDWVSARASTEEHPHAHEVRDFPTTEKTEEILESGPNSD